MAIIITQYSEKYRDDVRNICLDTAGSNAREEKSMRFLLATFCDYYIDREAEHCFIAVDEDTDSAVGYIFCAPDYQKYKRIFKAEYLPRVKGCKKGDIIEGVKLRKISSKERISLEMKEKYTNPHSLSERNLKKGNIVLGMIRNVKEEQNRCFVGISKGFDLLASIPNGEKISEGQKVVCMITGVNLEGYGVRGRILNIL